MLSLLLQKIIVVFVVLVALFHLEHLLNSLASVIIQAIIKNTGNT